MLLPTCLSWAFVQTGSKSDLFLKLDLSPMSYLTDEIGFVCPDIIKPLAYTPISGKIKTTNGQS